jgi:hypothetical protein
VDDAARHLGKGAPPFLIQHLALGGLEIIERMLELGRPFPDPFFERGILMLDFAAEKVRFEDIADAHVQLGDVKGFRQQIGGSSRQGALFVFRGWVAGYDENGEAGGWRILAQELKDLKAIEERHAQIEEQEVGLKILAGFQEFVGTIDTAQLGVTEPIENVCHHARTRDLVVEHEDAGSVQFQGLIHTFAVHS